MRIIDLPVPKYDTIKVEFVSAGSENARTCVVFMGGFLADALNGNGKAAVIKKLSQKKGYAFTRFNYVAHGMTPETRSPGMPTDITFFRMIEEACTAALATEMPEIIIVGSSVGAGLMPHVAMKIHKRSAKRVTAMFGIAAVTPDALFHEFALQLGSDINRLKPGVTMEVQIGAFGGIPFKLSGEQLQGIKDLRYLSRDRALPYQGELTLVSGEDDRLGHPRFTNRLVRALNVRKPEVHTLKGGDYDLDNAATEAYFTRFLAYQPS